MLSLLVGGVLGGQGARPRVAFVNEDDIPDVVHIGDRSFDFGRIVRAGRQARELVDHDAAARAQGARRRRRRRGDHRPARLRVRAVVADREPAASLLLTNRNAYEERILRETQSFVYTLNSEVQTEYIRSNSHFLDVLVSGGKAAALGRTYDVLGLDATQRAHPGGRGAAAGRQPARASSSTPSRPSPARPRRRSASPTRRSRRRRTRSRLVQRSTSGRSYLLGSQVQSYGLGISLAFVTLLLGAAVLTLERDENVLARLLRSGARPALLIAEKVALCAIVGCALGLLLALGFGVAAEISSSGAAWARIPLLLVPLAAAGAAFGALGCVVGAAARDLRASSLVGVALVTPIVLVGLVPRAGLAARGRRLRAPAVRPCRARVRRDAVRRRAALERARGERPPAPADGRAGRRALALFSAFAQLTSAPRGSGASAHLGVGQQRRDARGDLAGLLGAHPEERARPGARERAAVGAERGQVLLEAAEHAASARRGRAGAAGRRARAGSASRSPLASASTSSAVRCRL